jgi:hypothetical protein
MTKKKPRYESRVFDGRIIHSAEIERIHKEVLDFERIEAISEPMRELIEDPPVAGAAAQAFRRKGRTGDGAHHAPNRAVARPQITVVAFAPLPLTKPSSLRSRGQGCRLTSCRLNGRAIRGFET